MIELKTLKDFMKEYHYDSNQVTNVECIFNDLRQEAIKWIDLFQKKYCKPYYRALSCSHCQSIGDTIDWIKLFFNITEEDLK